MKNIAGTTILTLGYSIIGLAAVYSIAYLGMIVGDFPNIFWIIGG
jgi:uncharacterized membrane protein YuzA (DUF378 family)